MSKAFINILGVTKDRLQLIAKRFLETGAMPKELRGGNHQKPIYKGKRAAVRQFIESLNCVESHYCWGKSTRQYLPCNLNITKLFRQYNIQASEDTKVKKTFFIVSKMLALVHQLLMPVQLVLNSKNESTKRKTWKIKIN